MNNQIDDVVGIVLWTDNLDEMVSFYKDILELPLHSSRPNFVSFEFGNFRLNIGNHSEVHGIAKDPYRIMIHLSVPHIDYWYERLNSLGIKFIRAPEEESWGGIVATFPDPDGNMLQFLQFPS